MLKHAKKNKNGLHQPVLVKEVLENLLLESPKVICDATVGTGGHAEAIVAKVKPSVRLICIDRDANALNIARRRLAPYRNRICFAHLRFSQIENLLSRLNLKEVSGFLFDLGLCSTQLENKKRGFSFQLDGPLDMRMDRSQEKSAFEVVNYYSQSDLVKIFKRFGQEKYSKKIARAIVSRGKVSPISTTFQLRVLVESVINPKFRIKSLARVFQAIRIEVNQELEELKQGLNQAIRCLAPKGRLCVISYHSLEHRLIREKMRKESKGCICPPHLPVCCCEAKANLRVITTKPITPSLEEKERNPRARSARLWAAEKLTHV